MNLIDGALGYLSAGVIEKASALVGESPAGTRRALETAVPAIVAGLGGGYMAIITAGIFVPFMTGGLGFIAIVIAMLGRGKPIWVFIGSLLFGVALSIATALQLVGINIPTDVVQMLPFIVVMIALALFARHSYLPAALGAPFVRGER